MSAGVVSTNQASNVTGTVHGPHASAPCPAAAVFDRIAERYDHIFTHTTIGKLQRQAVWDVVASTFSKGQHILELNCGTGEDARFLAERDVSVTACDASSGMIEVARRREFQKDLRRNLEFHVLANEHLRDLCGGHLFDGALSNFSGLNCVEYTREIAASLGVLLRPAARLLICISSRVCAWEMFWYLARGEARKAFRRISGHTIATVDGMAVSVWYPTVRDIRRQFAPWFLLRSLRAVGLFVPPSYAEGWAQRHSKSVAACGKLDHFLGRIPMLRTLGDHMLLELERTHS